MSKTEENKELTFAEMTPWQKTCYIFKQIGKWIYLLRKIFLAIPVVYCAWKLAEECMERLPENVGLNFQATGEFAMTIARETAINGCLCITAACLLMMFCSRRTFYPWLMCFFSMILPIFLLLTNMFPMG